MAHKIFQIGLNEKSSNETAECILCKQQGTGKFKFQLSKSSVKSLITHLESSAHAGSEFVKKYEELNKTKEVEKIDKFMISGTNGISKLDKKVMNLICETIFHFT